MNIRLLIALIMGVLTGGVIAAGETNLPKKHEFIDTQSGLNRKDFIWTVANWQNSQREFIDRCMVDDFVTQWWNADRQTKECMELIENAREFYSLLYPDKRRNSKAFPEFDSSGSNVKNRALLFQYRKSLN